MDYIKEPSSRTIDQGDRIDEEEIRKVVEFYETELQQRTHGPQLVGFEGSQLAEALRNEPDNVFLLDILDEQGEVIGKWPLLVSTEYHQDLSQHFYEEHYPERASYYVSLPPYKNIGALIESSKDFEKVVQFLKRKNAIITYDYQEGDESRDLTPAFIHKTLENTDVTVRDITPESRAWDMEYGLPLALHYEGIARLIQLKDQPATTVAEAVVRLIAAGEAEYLPKNGVAFLGRQELEADDGRILEQLWAIYSEQFDELVEDHPVLGKQPRKEFEAMLLDEGTVNTAFMVNGEVAGLLYMVNDIEKCVWLNKEHYDKEFAGEDGWMTHFPGIVVAKDRARQGAGYAQQMIDMTLKAVAEMNKDMIITFACSNVSSHYIPKMVKRAITDSPLYDFVEERDKLHVSAEYGYRILEVG
jgi:hypothetical protein